MSSVISNRLLLNLRGSRNTHKKSNLSASLPLTALDTSKSHLTARSTFAQEDQSVGAVSRAETGTGDHSEDAITSGLGEYELHALRTLKPYRSARSV